MEVGPLPKSEVKYIRKVPLKERLEVECKTEWTISEKRQLFQAIKMYGMDVESISKCMLTKSQVEIKMFLESRCNMARETQLAACKVLSKKTPIDLWKDFTEQFPCGGVDFSRAVVEVFENIGYQNSHPIPSTSSSPNYPKIYKYLACILRGEPPFVLSPTDSAVVLRLLRTTSQKLNRMDLGGIRKELINHAKELRCRVKRKRIEDESKTSVDVPHKRKRLAYHAGSMVSQNSDAQDVYVSSTFTHTDKTTLNPFNILDIPVDVLKRVYEKFKKIHNL